MTVTHRQDRVATDLADYARSCYERGWMPGTSGNLSVRSGDRLLITASGRNKGELTPDDMIEVRLADGAVVGDARSRPSAETSIHAAVYAATDAAAVIHVHAPHATAVAWRRGDPDRVVQLRLTRFELLKGLGLADPSATDLPIFPNWPDVPRIARAVGAHLVARPDAPPALLIADHGVTVWGADLSQARNRLECLESMCHVLCLTGAGDGSPVTPARDLAKGAPS